jgi:flagellar biosynthesis protein
MKNKKRLKAAAIKYTKEDLDVPVISAYGSGETALRILEEAKKFNIEIVEDGSFFDFEKMFVIGKEIPQDVYRIVAEILAYILRTNKKERTN